MVGLYSRNIDDYLPHEMVISLRKVKRDLYKAIDVGKRVDWDDEDQIEILSYSLSQIREVLDEFAQFLADRSNIGRT